MRLIDAVLVASLVSAAASVGVAAWRRVIDPPAPPKAATPAPAWKITVHDCIEPKSVRCERDATGAEQRLRLVPAGGGAVLGVPVATVFPVEDGHPNFGMGEDAVATHVGEGILDLRPWLARKARNGKFLLHCDVVVGNAASSEVRDGWGTFEADELRTGGLSLKLDGGRPLEVEVRTPTGQPVPGALVAIDPDAPIGVGAVSLFAQTDDAGKVVVTGLAEGQKWIARLPNGAGPATGVIAQKFTLPRDRLTLVPTGLDGAWEFVRHEIELPFPGAAFRIESVENADREAPAVWPVVAWISPGRGPRAPFFFMRRAGASARPAQAKLKFAAVDAVDLADVMSPCTFTVATHDGKPALDCVVARAR